MNKYDFTKLTKEELDTIAIMTDDELVQDFNRDVLALRCLFGHSIYLTILSDVLDHMIGLGWLFSIRRFLASEAWRKSKSAGYWWWVEKRLHTRK